MSQINPSNPNITKNIISNNELPIYADKIVKFKISPYTTMLTFGNEADEPNNFNEVKTIAIPTTGLLDAMMLILKTLSKDESKTGLSDSLNHFIKQINELNVK